ncbi:MAG: phosphate/phosphite/phosphonate ABC transporter substrate-binding protein [Thermodesulfovibrionia bacterium]|nr:phosphate/phosphite/phosphonate ABC transporter substrate-binding protein [Thermodesulfovibrionia bacterium]
MKSCPVRKKPLLILLILFFAAHIAAASEEELVFAISPMASPVSTVSNYNNFIKYLSEKTGKKIILKQRRKYSEINSLLRTGEAQFAFTCTGAYLSGRYEFGLELLAVPVINGKTTYNSYIIVKKESEIENFRELAGKVFAFTDPLSFSGRLYPLYLIQKIGVKPEGYFGKTFYTSSHEKSIKAVADGLADGAAVDGLIFENMKRMNDPAIEKIKIIEISPPYGIPPIVASPRTEKSTKQLMLRTLIKMADDHAGREILDRIDIEKFVLPDPAIYNTAQKLRQATLVQ